MKAKTASLLSKVVAGVVLIVGHFLMWYGKMPNANSHDIICCSITIMGVFGTIDLNLIFEKFTGKRISQNTE